MSFARMQNSFLSGELSPDISARTNIEAYEQGLAEAYNVFVDYRGGVNNRAGTQFCAIAPTANLGYFGGVEQAIPRLVPFIFDDNQSLVLVFTDLLVGFISDGAPVLLPSEPITDITQDDPGVVEVIGHSVGVGSIVYISGVGGMTEVNNRYFMVYGPTTDTFELYDLFTGTPLDTTGYSAYTSGGIIREVYLESSPYDSEDLWSLKFVQSRDVIVIVSPFYEPRTLTRVASNNWVFATITFESSTTAPTGLALDPSFTGSGTGYTYVVTAVDKDTGVESEASSDANDSFNYWPTPEDNIKITWSAVTGADFYNIYRAPVTPGRAVPTSSLRGRIGQTRGLSFNDLQFASNFALTPPKSRDPFGSSSNYPGVTAFIKQRLAFGATINRPFKMWMSPVGDFLSMNRSQPPQDTDSLSFELASTRADPIKNLLAMPGGLLTFTTEAVYHTYGGADGSSMTPNNINSDPVSYFGASELTPIGVGYHVLYTQNDGGLIRDLQYNFFAASYESTDITILASHLFKGHNIIRWAYANSPWKVIWAIRDDGKILSLTYVPEQNIFAFCLHQTLGYAVDVCVIPEGDEDVAYFAINRGLVNTLYGPLVNIERMRSRVIKTIEDAWFFDNALSSDLITPAGAISISAASGTGVAVSSVTSSNPFSASVVGRVIRAGGGMMKITAKADSNNVTVEVLRPVTNLNSDGVPMLVGPGAWSMNAEFSTFGGLWHLEGQEVMALADGGVQGPFTVEDGSITLTTRASYVVAGIPFKSRIKTLRPEIQTQTGSSQNKRKNIPAATIRMAQTRGVKIGPSYEEAQTWNPRVVQPLGQPPLMVTGDEYVVIGGFWNEEAQIYLEQDQPLPMSVLGLIMETTVGDT